MVLVLAQKTGKINGNLLDNQQAIEFATVTLAKLPDSTKIAHFTTTDSLGRFSFENIILGNYTIKISLIGYKTYAQNIILSAEKPIFNLNNLRIVADDKLLNEVVITSQKKLIEK